MYLEELYSGISVIHESGIYKHMSFSNSVASYLPFVPHNSKCRVKNYNKQISQYWKLFWLAAEIFSIQTELDKMGQAYKCLGYINHFWKYMNSSFFNQPIGTYHFLSAYFGNNTLVSLPFHILCRIIPNA